jgi:hypothetical protein
MLTRTLVALAIFLMLPVCASAQQLGNISGFVMDSSGAVLPGARMSAINLETGLQREVMADSEGRFNITSVPAGEYELASEAQGFARWKTKVRLEVAQQLEVTARLQPAGAKDEVIVTAQETLVNTTGAQLSGVINDREIRDLPLNGRNYAQLVLLQPGVVERFNINRTTGSQGHGLQLDISGARPQSNVFTIDGAVVNTHMNHVPQSSSGTTLGVEAIREFRTITLNAPAEFGRGGGGFIVAVTQSGTNSFHGSAFEFLRNDAFDAQNFFDRDKPPLRRNQFGGTLGGPIIRNRTFFFGVYEALIERFGQTITATVPDRPLISTPDPQIVKYLTLYPAPNGRRFSNGTGEYQWQFVRKTDEHYAQLRIDHSLSDKTSFFGRYTFDDSDYGIPIPNGLPSTSVQEKSRNQYFTFGGTRVMTPRVVNDLNFSVVRLFLNQVNERNGPALDPALGYRPGELIGTFTIGGLSQLGTAIFVPQLTRQTRTSLRDDLTYTIENHILKFGASFENIRTAGSLNSGGTVGGYSNVYVFPNLAALLANRPSAFREGGIVPFLYYRQTLCGFYGQDSVKITPHLTLNLGLRYEPYTSPIETQGRVFPFKGIEALNALTSVAPNLQDKRLYKTPAAKNLGPRIGVAWDPFRNGKTAIRAGFGIFYDPLLQNLFYQNPISPLFGRRQLIPSPRIGDPIPAFDFARETFLLTFAHEFEVKSPRYMHYNLQVQRELPGGIAVSVGYAGSKGDNLITTAELNTPQNVQVSPDGKYSFSGPLVAPKFQGGVQVKRTNGESWYNSLQIAAQKRLTAGLAFQGAYTWSHAIDEGSGVSTTDNLFGGYEQQNPFDKKGERGNANFDIRHNFTANFTYEVPGTERLTGGARVLLGNWQINGIARLVSGPPFNPVVMSSRSGIRRAESTGQERPDLKPGVDIKGIVLGSPDRYFDPTAFLLPAAGTLGNVGRNILRAPGLVSFDLAMAKEFPLTKLGEKTRIQFRTEIFNIFNHANFGVPNYLVYTGAAANESPLPTAGRITDTTTTARQLQFSLKLKF